MLSVVDWICFCSTKCTSIPMPYWVVYNILSFLCLTKVVLRHVRENWGQNCKTFKLDYALHGDVWAAHSCVNWAYFHACELYLKVHCGCIDPLLEMTTERGTVEGQSSDHIGPLWRFSLSSLYDRTYIILTQENLLPPPCQNWCSILCTLCCEIFSEILVAFPLKRYFAESQSCVERSCPYEFRFFCCRSCLMSSDPHLMWQLFVISDRSSWRFSGSEIQLFRPDRSFLESLLVDLRWPLTRLSVNVSFLASFRLRTVSHWINPGSASCQTVHFLRCDPDCHSSIRLQIHSKLHGVVCMSLDMTVTTMYKLKRARMCVYIIMRMYRYRVHNTCTATCAITCCSGYQDRSSRNAQFGTVAVRARSFAKPKPGNTQQGALQSQS